MGRVDVKELLDAGVHFGHRTERWNPKMKPFIFEARNGIYVINLNESAKQLEEACSFLRKVAGDGQKVLFVGCKKQAQEAVRDASQKCGAFYVTERWMGGTLTNLATIKRSVARMKQIDELETKGQFDKIAKKEVSALRRENTKLHRNLDGIKEMDKAPAAVVIIDVVREHIAVTEAKRLNIPIVGIVDTNADPDQVDFPVAGNDDAIRSIRLLVEILADAVTEGRSAGKDRRSSKAEAADAVAVSA